MLRARHVGVGLVMVASFAAVACGDTHRELNSQAMPDGGAGEPTTSAGAGGRATAGNSAMGGSGGLAAGGTMNGPANAGSAGEGGMPDTNAAGAAGADTAGPVCGNGRVEKGEACDGNGSGSTDLGSCNPECTGFYEKKYIRATDAQYDAGKLGGPLGADAKCQMELGAGWKALLVGGARRATKTPYLGDSSTDWVIHKYTHYYSYFAGKLLWRTDDVPLLGVHDGKRVNVYADAFKTGGSYPWSGWDTDWTTLADDDPRGGTCQGWTSTKAGTWANFAFADLTPALQESCGGSMSFILCVEQ